MVGFLLLPQWAHSLGKKSKPQVRVPLHPCEHFYITTKPIEGMDPMMPGTVHLVKSALPILLFQKIKANGRYAGIGASAQE